MTIRGQHGKRQLYFHTVLVFTILAVIFTAAFTAAGLSGDQTRKIKFELRLASHQKVEGWEIGFVPGPPKTPVWISPEVALTNSDIARAWPQPDADGFVIGIMLTEEGSLKLARLTKSHIGENVAIMVDGQVMSAPKIMAEITGGRAIIHGTFTEAEAGALAKGIMMK
jgi:preprotein translocase subunit SecD